MQVPTLDEIAREEHRRRYARDPWAWVAECVSTVDETDLATPIKPFPIATCIPCHRYLGGALAPVCSQCGAPGRRLEYLHEIMAQWLLKDPPVLVIPKPRRMFLSWLMVALHTWLCVFHRGANVFIVSSKEEKSRELINRAEGILRRVPPDCLVIPPWERSQQPPAIRFSEHARGPASQLIGIPEGPDQLRQYTATAIFADEVATWKWPRASYTAMRPTIDGGGQITLVSSAYPGFFHQLVSGELTG